MFNEVLLRLSKILYPKGRAFKMPASLGSPPVGGMLERLDKALIKSEDRLLQAALSTYDSILPDNPNFTADDATYWEGRLGIYSAPGTLLADRILAIKTKYNFPGTVAPRQHYSYIQDELQAAGFNVYVHENRFLEGSPPGYVVKTPRKLLEGLNIFYGDAHYGLIQYGQTNYGGQTGGVTKCVNYIEESKDQYFNVGDNYRSTFYIGGDFSSDLNLFASISTVRKDEFRQLILQLKPAQSVAFLIINYV